MIGGGGGESQTTTISRPNHQSGRGKKGGETGFIIAEDNKNGQKIFTVFKNKGYKGRSRIRYGFFKKKSEAESCKDFLKELSSAELQHLISTTKPPQKNLVRVFDRQPYYEVRNLIHILFERCPGMIKPLLKKEEKRDLSLPPLSGGGGNVPGSHFLPFFRPMGAPIQFHPPPSTAMAMASATPDLTLHGEKKPIRQRPVKKSSTAKKAPSGYNKKKLSQSTSIYRGVSKNTGETSWKACGTYRGTVFHLGYFEKEEDAAKAYDDWASMTLGDQAVLNFDRKTGQPNHHVKGENESIYKGVSKHQNKWQANVWNKILKKQIYLGLFDDEEGVGFHGGSCCCIGKMSGGI